MTDQQAIDILKHYTAWVQLARGSGRSVTAFRYTWALTCAILALERKMPCRVTIKGKIVQRRYCPTCQKHVKKGQEFCSTCGQALREWSFKDANPILIRPLASPHGYGYKTESVVLDEFHSGGSES